MRSRLVLGIAATAGFVPLAVATGAAASHCDAGRFCAYDLTNYDHDEAHPRLLNSGAAAGTGFVDVADNRVSSVKNRTGNNWCGVESSGWPDRTVFRIAPHTWNASLGSEANNQIDHFYVRASTSSCD